jgi:hypothetical protein
MREAVFGTEKTTELELSLNHQLSRRFEATIALTKVDRDGDLGRRNQSFIGLNGPFSDNRLTFTITYNFGNRR